MEWQVFDTGSASAEKNMALDDELLHKMSSRQQPILHFYDWKGNCATYGHFLDPYTLLHKKAVEKHHLQLAKRPTGGGLVFHLTDFAYSILIPAAHVGYSVNTLENYAFINRMIANVIQKFLGTKNSPTLYSQKPTSLSHISQKISSEVGQEDVASDALSNARKHCQIDKVGAFEDADGVTDCPNFPSVCEKNELARHSGHFCMAKPTKYDVMVEGSKVGGAAQRRTKHGFLHQGTIFIALPPEDIFKPLLKNRSIWEAMKQNTYPFLSHHTFPQSVNTVRQKLKTLLIEEILP